MEFEPEFRNIATAHDGPSPETVALLEHVLDGQRGPAETRAFPWDASFPRSRERVDFRRRLAAQRDTIAELRQTGREQAAVQQAKDELLGLISHELRSPLTAIAGHARLLQRVGEGALDDANRAQSIDDIVRYAARMRLTIDNMMALAHLEGDGDADMEPLLLQHLLPKAVAEHAVEARVEVKVPADLATVVANPTYVALIVGNLVNNAAKYGPAGAVVSVHVSARDGEAVIVVASGGPVLTVEATAHLFEPFFRAAATRNTRPGDGLGLTVCSRLTDAQGGRIWATPRLGGGLEVAFTLPFACEPVLE